MTVRAVGAFLASGLRRIEKGDWLQLKRLKNIIGPTNSRCEPTSTRFQTCSAQLESS